MIPVSTQGMVLVNLSQFLSSRLQNHLQKSVWKSKGVHRPSRCILKGSIIASQAKCDLTRLKRPQVLHTSAEEPPFDQQVLGQGLIMQDCVCHRCFRNWSCMAEFLIQLEFGDKRISFHTLSNAANGCESLNNLRLC
ncbi:hypothetical protein ABKN59_004341 [Abortiporus biennis]